MTRGTWLIGSAVGVALVVAVGVSCVPAQSQDDGPGAGPHTLAEYDAMFTELNNWGRWGADDERGTANLVTEAKRREAAGLVTRGVSVSLSHNPMPDAAADNPDSAFEHVMADGFRVDTIQFNYHGYGVSHIDALCHFLHNGMLYNGVPASASTADGCGKQGIQNLKDGIVTRGVLLDIPRLKGVPYLEPGTAIYTEDIEDWLEQAGVTVSSGDAVFLRTGRWARRAELGPWPIASNSAGLHISVGRWIKEHDIAFFGSDASTDVQPSMVEGVGLPVHTFLIAGLGMNIFDNMDLEALAEMAAAENRWEFMLTAGPIPVTGGTGSPLNAIAVF